MSSGEQQRLRHSLLQDVFQIFWMRVRIVHGSYPRLKTLNADRLVLFRKRAQTLARFDSIKNSIKEEQGTANAIAAAAFNGVMWKHPKQHKKITGIRTCGIYSSYTENWQ